MRLAILFIVLACVAYGVRDLILARNSAALAKTSAAFSHDYYVGSPKDPKILYAVLGDSTVEGTGAPTVSQTLPSLLALKLASQGKYVHVVNLAKTGAKMADVVAFQLPALAALKPDVLTLNCGANDATHFTSAKSYRADLQKILAAGSSVPQFVVASSPDLSLLPALPPIFNAIVGARSKAQNDTLSDLVSSQKIQVVDLYSNGRLTRPDQYAADKFHPSPTGYAVWANLYPF